MDSIFNNVKPAADSTENSNEDLKIRLPEPVPFCSSGSIQFTTSIELSKIINDIFCEVFDDFVGSSINVRQDLLRNGVVVTNIIPELHFRVLSNNSYSNGNTTAFKPLISQPNDDMLRRVQRVSQMSMASGVKINMTDDGKSVLEDFIITPKNYKRDKFEWDKIYTLRTVDSDTFIRVFNLDIMKLIKKMYGERDIENNSELTYQINPVECRHSGYGSMPDNWKLVIMRYNVANTMKSAELTGVIPPNFSMNGAIRMVPATNIK